MHSICQYNGIFMIEGLYFLWLAHSKGLDIKNDILCTLYVNDDQKCDDFSIFVTCKWSLGFLSLAMFGKIENS